MDSFRLVHRLGHEAQPLDGVGDVDGQGSAHHHDAVSHLVVLALGAHRHRHQRAQTDALGVHAAGDQEGAQGPGHYGEHDIVDGASEGVLDDLEVLERIADAEKAPVWADVHVQRRFRGRVQAGPDDLADPLGAFAGAGERVVGMRERIHRSLRERHRRAHGPAQPGRDELHRAGLPMGLPCASGVLDRGRLAGEIEEHSCEVDARDAVDQRVMGFGDQCEAVVLEALDQPHLPQRLGAVELLGEDPCGQALQLDPGPGRRQRRVAHVVLEVEVRVIDPHRAP